MSGFFYYLSGQRAIKAAKADALGLSYARDGGGPSHAGINPGPDEKVGVVFAFADARGNTPPLALAGAPSVRWMEQPGNPELWLGYEPSDPPGPTDLARREQRPGHPVTLTDGHEWIVPVARLLDGQPALPRRLSWDGQAWTPGEVLDRYTDLFAAACRVWDALMEAGEVTLDESCDVAATALAVNYRIGPAEISLLGLFDTDSHAAIIRAMIDWPAVEALKKKLDSGELSLEPGGGASSPDTDPAPPNSSSETQSG